MAPLLGATMKAVQQLWAYRALLFMITYRDIRVRYKQSVMGFLWAILMPVLIIMAGIVVRYAYALAARVPLETHEVTGVAVKSLPWAFLVSSIRFASLSLISNRDLVTKIYFPREVFPVAAVAASLFDCVVASGALIVFLLAAQVGWSPALVWTPLLLLTLVCLALGMSMIVSAASLFFRDVKFIVDVLLTYGIFFTPVFYDVSMFGDRGKWLLINPVSPILEGFSACIARHEPPDLRWCAYSLAFALVILIGGYRFFKRLEPAFAESI
jgi:ABC-type polysaccharide/polyol phosphate export permease